MANQADSGHIDEASIQEAINTIREIVDAYADIQLTVSLTTENARLNWVGEGRNAFETQYNTLIRKIDDFGDTLKDIYEGLVDALASYQETDLQVMQGYVKVTEDMKG